MDLKDAQCEQNVGHDLINFQMVSDTDGTLVQVEEGATASGNCARVDDIADDIKQLQLAILSEEDVVSLNLVGLGAESELLSPAGSLAHSVSEASGLTDRLDSPQKVPPSDVTVTGLPCEMCANYETKLQQLQEAERTLNQQLSAARHLSDRYHTELSGERLYRNELETKMTVLSKEAQDEVKKVGEQTGQLEERMKTVEAHMEHTLEVDRTEFDAVRLQSEEVQRQMTDIHTKYTKLVGLNRAKSAELRAEAIELPQTVEELQLVCLQLREELIETKAAKEHQHDILQGDIALLRERLTGEQDKASQLEENLLEEINLLRTKLGTSESQVTALAAARQHAEEVEKRLAEFQSTIDDLETRLGTLQTERGELEFNFKESKKRCATLQHELDTSETVQKDFVKLSQSLQIELEKIRQAEQEVRWQFAEDVYLCPGCKQPFTKMRSKHNCCHCGKIFCETCLGKIVPSGPHRRPAKVCEVCHTLLVSDTAPYFSESVPNSS